MTRPAGIPAPHPRACQPQPWMNNSCHERVHRCERVPCKNEHESVATDVGFAVWASAKCEKMYHTKNVIDITPGLRRDVANMDKRVLIHRQAGLGAVWSARKCTDVSNTYGRASVCTHLREAVDVDMRVLIHGQGALGEARIDQRANAPAFRLRRAAVLRNVDIDMTGFREALLVEGGPGVKPFVQRCVIRCGVSKPRVPQRQIPFPLRARLVLPGGATNSTCRRAPSISVANRC